MGSKNVDGATRQRVDGRLEPRGRRLDHLAAQQWRRIGLGFARSSKLWSQTQLGLHSLDVRSLIPERYSTQKLQRILCYAQTDYVSYSEPLLVLPSHARASTVRTRPSSSVISRSRTVPSRTTTIPSSTRICTSTISTTQALSTLRTKARTSHQHRAILLPSYPSSITHPHEKCELEQESECAATFAGAG